MFPDSTQSHSDPLELRIAAELWRWAFLKDDARSEVLSPQGSLALSIEFYLCGVFHIVPVAQSQGWWCDGVIELSITKISRTSFRIVGAAYWGNSAPCYLAPFELEFHFAKRRDSEPARIIVRFGDLSPSGLIRLCTSERESKVIATNRPTRERDWVIAVELYSIMDKDPKHAPLPEENSRSLAAYEQYIATFGRPPPNLPLRCPCCGCKTLPVRSKFEICEVCYWEDDGQDDYDADVVRGGPNGALSLSAARENYLRVGACEESMVENVHPPRPDEMPNSTHD